MLDALDAEHAQLAAAPRAALEPRLAAARERVAQKAGCFDSDYLGWHTLHWLPQERNAQQLNMARNGLPGLTEEGAAATNGRSHDRPMTGAENPPPAAPTSRDEQQGRSATEADGFGDRPEQQQDRFLAVAARPPQFQQVRTLTALMLYTPHEFAPFGSRHKLSSALLARPGDHFVQNRGRCMSLSSEMTALLFRFPLPLYFGFFFLLTRADALFSLFVT